MRSLPILHFNGYKIYQHAKWLKVTSKLAVAATQRGTQFAGHPAHCACDNFLRHGRSGLRIRHGCDGDGAAGLFEQRLYQAQLAKQLKCSIIVLSIIDNRPLIAQTFSARENARRIIEPIEDCMIEAAEENNGAT
jgi:hypothetical protein